MKVAIINDTHAGLRNGADVFLDHAELFYQKVFFPYCQSNGIKTVIHAGDFNDHRKMVSIKTLNRTRKSFLEPLTDLGMNMVIIPGNHDVYFKNTNDLCGLREVLGYFIDNVQIVSKPSVLRFDGLDIGFLPWIAPDNYAESMKFISEAQASILIAHLELAGFEVMKGQPAQEHGMDPSLFKRFEMVLSGHYHTKSTRDNIYYLGCQFQQTWADCDDSKYFHVLDTQTRELVQVKNPFTLFERVVYNDASPVLKDPDRIDLSYLKGKFVKIVVTKKGDPSKFDRFVTRCEESGCLEPPRIVETFEEFMSDRVEDDQIDLEDTGNLLRTYVEATETSLDKARLQNMIHELYVEAQAMNPQA